MADIYENADAVRRHETSTVTENNDSTGNLQTPNAGGDIAKRRLTAASLLVLLCVSLLAGVIVLGVTFNTKTTAINQLRTKFTNLNLSREQLQICYDNLTTRYDQLQTEYSNLTLSTEQLQTSYDNMTTSNKWLQSRYAQLQIRYDNVTIRGVQLQMGYDNLSQTYDQLNTRYNNVTLSGDQLQISYDNLTVEQRRLTSSYKTLTEERNQLQKERNELNSSLSALVGTVTKLGWDSFSSSLYYVSTVAASWDVAKQDCRSKGANLVIINSREEQAFVEMLRVGQAAWIILYDQDVEGHWKWVDGSELTVGFWASQESNNYNGIENCVITGYLKPSSDILDTWNDCSCNSQYIWICEQPISL